MEATENKSAEIISAIEKMTVLELAQLVKTLEEKFGVSAAAPVIVSPAAAGSGVGDSTKEEVADEHTVVLISAGEKKIQTLKVVRELTGLGLKEAKELVDSTPKPIKEKVPKAEAESMKKKLEEQGATVEIK